MYIPQVLNESKKRDRSLPQGQSFEFILGNFSKIASRFIAIQKTKINKSRVKNELKKVRARELEFERSQKELSRADKMELRIRREEIEKVLTGEVYFKDGSPVMTDQLTYIAQKHILFKSLNFLIGAIRIEVNVVAYILKETIEKSQPIISMYLKERERRKEEKRQKEEKRKEEQDVRKEEENGSIILDSKQVHDRILELSKSFKERKWRQLPFSKKPKPRGGQKQ